VTTIDGLGQSATETERLLAAMLRVVEALHGLARDVDLTNDELMAVLAFVGEVAAADELVLLSDVIGVSRLVDDQTHRGMAGTESNVLGPFYVDGAPAIPNPGSIRTSATAGVPMAIRGRITGTDGDVLAGAVVDVWQADGDGRYSMPSDGDRRWELRGRQTTDAEGGYDVATVQPGDYQIKHDGPVGRLLEALGRHPWRPAHVHLRVSHPGFVPLVTQAYVASGPYLSDDAIAGVKDELVTPVVDGTMGFDIVLARDER
jgi:hydroxyquinol 1,2-dioxygenase